MDRAGGIFEIRAIPRTATKSSEFSRVVTRMMSTLPSTRRSTPSQVAKNTPWPARGDIILRAAEILAERKEELAQLMTREMGKVLVEARGALQEAIDMGKFIAVKAGAPSVRRCRRSCATSGR